MKKYSVKLLEKYLLKKQKLQSIKGGTVWANAGNLSRSSSGN